MNKLDNENKEMRKKLAEERLNCIDILFAAFGPFVSALFCIAQYFLDETIWFKIIAAGLYFLILFTTYYLAAFNKQKNYEKFWKHIKKYAKAAGLLNPLILAVSILLAIVRNVWVLMLCVILVVTQIAAYIILGYKQEIKVE